MFRFKLIPSKQKIMILKHYVSFPTNCFEMKQKILFQIQKKFLKRKKLFL